MNVQEKIEELKAKLHALRPDIVAIEYRNNEAVMIKPDGEELVFMEFVHVSPTREMLECLDDLWFYLETEGK